MIILTKYGEVDFDDLNKFELSKEAIEYLNNRKNASEIFFSSEIDLTDESEEFDDLIQEIAIIAIAENKFAIPEKAFAISEFLNVPISEVESSRTDTFQINGEEYFVLTDEEADEMAFEMQKSLLDDVGIDGFPEGIKSQIYSQFVDTKWFDDAMHESNENYAYDIKDENADSDEYLNRLHQEMVEKNILPEPEWPDDEDEKDDYKNDLESLIDSSIEEFIAKLNSTYKDGLEYWIDNFGSEAVADVANKNNLIDYDGLARYIIQLDGRVNSIPTYDGNEERIVIKYKGVDHEFYIYRSN